MLLLVYISHNNQHFYYTVWGGSTFYTLPKKLKIMNDPLIKI